MTRCRRPRREVLFSFDSFLDVVANVVGVIIRLILIAWVGARSYRAFIDLPPPPPPPPAIADPAPLPDPTDSRLEELARRRQQVSRQAQQALRQQKEKEEKLRQQQEKARREMKLLAAKRASLEQQQTQLQQQASDRNKVVKTVLLSVEELQARSNRLLAELKKAKELPKATKKLRYRTPVSAVVQTEEMMFECKNGRVTLLDTAALLEEIRRVSRNKGEQLRDQWMVTDATPPVGAFRLRFVIERERTVLDGPGGVPATGPYRYGLSSWEAEPIMAERGETVTQALATGSAFRKLVDNLEVQQTVVTFWVYPDSFALYRELRDYLHKRDIVVAGRPLPEGVPIASSRKGTASRGQ